MADALSTGIGLSGSFDFSTTGLEPVLEAEKSLAGRRAAEERQRQKERSALEKEVRKLTVFDKNFNTALYQKQWEDASSRTIAEMIQKVQDGDDDALAYAYNAKKELNSIGARLKSADDSVVESYKNVLKDPSSYPIDNPVEIAGKEYNTWYDFVNDPASADPEVFEEGMNNFHGSEFAFNKDDKGLLIAGYNPIEMADPFDVLMDKTKPSQFYTEPREIEKIGENGRTWKILANHLPKEIKDQAIKETLESPAVRRRIEHEAMKNKPEDMSYADFQRIELPKYVQQQEEQMRARADKQAIEKSRVETTGRPAKAAKDNSFNKNYNLSDFTEQSLRVNLGSAGSEKEEKEFVANAVQLIPRTSFAKQPTTIPKTQGTFILKDNGQMETKDLGTMKASPKGVYWLPKEMGDKAGLKMAYQDDTGAIIFKPYSNGTLKEFMALAFIEDQEDRDNLYESMRELAKGDETILKQVNAGWKDLTGTDMGVIEGAKAEKDKENSSGMITVILNGKAGQVPSGQIDAFMKKYPTAKRQ